eukprot:g10305.t2
MSTSDFSDDVSRNRYDHLVFGISLPGSNAGGQTGAGATCSDGIASRERKWLLELGAMTLLEAELETLSVDGPQFSTAANQRAQGNISGTDTQAQETEWYNSCLETMLDGHYDVLDGLEDRLPGSSRVEAIPATSTAPTTLAAASSSSSSRSISKETVRGDAFRAVDTSTLLEALPGLLGAAGPRAAAAATGRRRGRRRNSSSGNSSSGSGGGGRSASGGAAEAAAAAAAPITGGNTVDGLGGNGTASSGDASAKLPPRGAGRYNGNNDTSSSRSSSSSSSNGEAGKCVVPQPRRQDGTPAGAPGGPLNPYAAKGPKRGNTDTSSNVNVNVNANTGAGSVTPFPPSLVRGAGGAAPVPRFPGAGTEGGVETAARRAAPPSNYHQKHKQQQEEARGDFDAQRNAFGGHSSGPIGSQHHPHRQPQQPAHQQHQHQHQRGAPCYGDRDTALAPRGVPGVGRGGRDPAPAAATADAWAARDPPPPRGGLFASGSGAGAEQGPGRHGPGQGQRYSGNGMAATTTTTTGPFKTARELRAADIAPGSKRGGTNNGNSNSNSNSNSNDFGRRGGEQHQHQHQYHQQQRSWDGRDSGKGGGGGAGGGMWGGSGSYTHQGQGGYSIGGSNGFDGNGNYNNGNGSGNGGGGAGGGGAGADEEPLPEELAHLEKAMVDKVMQEVQQKGDPVTFDQIAGLEFAKKSVIELVCWPMERPDIFTGLRSLPKGLLLFGPPGTGKTLIGKAIAHQSGATFFSISASSLCSKWIGEGEKMVRTLFAVAGYHQPAVIFIDEVDSMLSMRSADENEASRRLKTEFLIQLDGAGTKAADRVLVVGATNRPQELDEAARRRFVKRLYVPLPDKSGRRQLMNILLKTSPSSLTAEDVEEIVDSTDGFSGADLHSLCTEAAMGPVRDLGSSICTIKVADVPPMETRHFTEARQSMRPSVGAEEIQHYLKWNEEFGSFKRA